MYGNKVEGMVAQPYEYTKCHCIVHSKMVHFMSCALLIQKKLI